MELFVCFWDREKWRHSGWWANTGVEFFFQRTLWSIHIAGDREKVILKRCIESTRGWCHEKDGSRESKTTKVEFPFFFAFFLFVCCAFFFWFALFPFPFEFPIFISFSFLCVSEFFFFTTLFFLVSLLRHCRLVFQYTQTQVRPLHCANRVHKENLQKHPFVSRLPQDRIGIHSQPLFHTFTTQHTLSCLCNISHTHPEDLSFRVSQ